MQNIYLAALCAVFVFTAYKVAYKKGYNDCNDDWAQAYRGCYRNESDNERGEKW